MSALMTPRMGRHIERVMLDQYGAFYTGFYRAERNGFLLNARNATDEPREQYIRWAMHSHRQMMRTLREWRREQRLAREAQPEAA